VFSDVVFIHKIIVVDEILVVGVVGGTNVDAFDLTSMGYT